MITQKRSDYGQTLAVYSLDRSHYRSDYKSDYGQTLAVYSLARIDYVFASHPSKPHITTFFFLARCRVKKKLPVQLGDFRELTEYFKNRSEDTIYPKEGVILLTLSYLLSQLLSSNRCSST